MGTTTVRIALATGLAVGASALDTVGAFAMPSPVDNPTAAAVAAQNIEQARWVCGPYRCWWRSGYYRHHQTPYWGYGYNYGRPYWGYGGYGDYGGYGYRPYINPCD